MKKFFSSGTNAQLSLLNVDECVQIVVYKYALVQCSSSILQRMIKRNEDCYVINA